MLNDTLRIGIYGGTFDPVHNGHIAAAEAFITQMELDILYIIPAGVPPHKEAHGAGAMDRYRMCEIAFRDHKKVLVSDMEIARAGKSYTVDTLRALSGSDRRLFLLMGTDMMLTLDTWRAPEEIFKLAYPVYIRRENDPILSARIVAKNNEYLAKYGKVVRRLVADVRELSSTEVRARLAAGESLAGLVPSDVERYIREHSLYV